MPIKYAYIDDNSDDIDYFNRKFPGSYVVKNPEEYTKLVANDNIDVFLVDVFLKQPGVQLEIVKKIRDKHPNKPIIFVSGIDKREAHDIKIIFANWDCGFIEKPVTEDKIREELCRLERK